MLSHFKAIAVACIVAFTGVSHAAGTWETTLLGRDITGKAVDGSSASAVFLYDTTLDITWLRDANVNGTMNWSDANSWATGYSVGSYGGWRLPMMVDTGPLGCDPNSAAGGTDCGYNVATGTSEMAHLYYVTLGNLAACMTASWCPQPNQPGWGLANKGNFLNLGAVYGQSAYWFGTENALDKNHAWYFENRGGYQSGDTDKANLFHAMAVRPGDVLAAVPESETYAMMLAGLSALGVLARRRKQTG